MLSQKARYALRALLLLAEAPGGTVLQVQDIAARQKVPRRFLGLILLEIKRHGMLQSMRGRSGGFLLTRAPDQITFGQIIRLMDRPLVPLPCASVTTYRRCADCDDEGGCEIRLVMRQVRDAMADVLDNRTLADAAPCCVRAQAAEA